MNFGISAIMVMAGTQFSLAQADEARMQRDIEVAENVLATLIKHEMGGERTFFGLDIRGSYQPGYGATFRLPPDQTIPIVISISPDQVGSPAVISNGAGYRYSFRVNGTPQPAGVADAPVYTLKDKTMKSRGYSADSLQHAYHEKMIKAISDFILDYGDLISGLAPDERIMVTNQSDRPSFYFGGSNRARISVEGRKADIMALKQGKLTREQAQQKLTVVNTEFVDVKEPDMEILSSIFSRLYHADVSKTYFTEGNVYYERLKDYGAIYYMKMMSSVEKTLNRFYLPTLSLDGVDQQERDRKVKELYPLFEQEMKENILEYGRTLKSLKEDEVLVFNITLTKCTGCAIPTTLELTIPAGVLKDFGSGKINKQAALGEFIAKKGPAQ